MDTQLHQEFESLAGDNAAVYVAESVLKRLALQSLIDNLQLRRGKVFQVTETKPFVAKLVHVGTLQDPTSGTMPEGSLSSSGSDIFLEVAGGLSVEVAIGFNGSATGDPPTMVDHYATVTMSVRQFKFLVSAIPSKLVVEAAEAVFIPSITAEVDDGTMGQFASTHGVDKDELHRIEGLLAYSGIQTQIALSVSQPNKIEFTRLFYGLKLSGELHAHVSSSSTSLGNSRVLMLIPSEGISSNPDTVCECGGSDNGIGMAPGSQFDPNTGDIQFGDIGPADQSKLDFGLGQNGDGGVGVYIPRSLAEVIVDGVFPAIRVDFSNNGFVGFSAHGVADFGDIDFDFVPGDLELEVRVGFRLAAHGRIHIDLGKLGKPKIGDFHADQGSSTANTVVVRIRLAIEDGVVYLKPYIRRLSIGSFSANVNFFANVLSPFGSKGALIGFIIDRILEPIFAHNIPFLVRDAIKDYFVGLRWKLVDAQYYGVLASITKHHMQPGSTTSMTNNSLLAGAEWVAFDGPYPGDNW